MMTSTPTTPTLDQGVPLDPHVRLDPQARREHSAALSEALRHATGDEAVGLRRRLVELHLDAADSVARHYSGRGQDHQDLVQVARLGLVEASGRYEPGLGSFLGFAVPTMMGVVRRHFRDRAWSVKPPRCLQEHAAALAKAREDLTQHLQRRPSHAELGAHLGLSEAEVAAARQTDGCFQATSLDLPAGQRPESLGDSLPLLDDRYDRVETTLTLRPACARLDARDQKLLHLRFYSEMSQREIAEVFGVSQMQISRWLARVLRTLRTSIGEDAVLAMAS